MQDHYQDSVRFTVNSTVYQITGFTPACLIFRQEIRTPEDILYDLRKVVEAENFVSRIASYLKKLAANLCDDKITKT